MNTRFFFKQLYWFKNPSELSDVSLLQLAVASHAAAVEELDALPIVEGFPCLNFLSLL